MKYTLDNGKVINIPDDEIAKHMHNLKCSEAEAIEIYLEDEEIVVSDETRALNEKAQKFKVQHGVVPEPKKPRKPREKKEDVDKTALISTIAAALMAFTDAEAVITNPTKIIEFDYNGEHYKVDLVRQRKPKEN